MHGNEEHLLGESAVSLGVRQVPHLCTHLLIKLSHNHYLLHFLICKRATFIRIKMIHHLGVRLFVFRRDAPDRITATSSISGRLGHSRLSWLLWKGKVC